MVVGVGSFTASAKSEKLLSNGFFTYYHSGDDYVVLVRAVDRDYTGKTFVIPYKIDGREVICANDLLLSDLRKSGNADTITSIKIEEGITQLMTYYTVYKEMSTANAGERFRDLKISKKYRFRAPCPPLTTECSEIAFRSKKLYSPTRSTIWATRFSEAALLLNM